MSNKLTTSMEREQAFILLFEKSFNEEVDAEKIIDLALECEAVEGTDYTLKLFTETCNKQPVIDEFISKYSTGRAINRISRVSLAILRMTVCEIRYFEKVPTAVSINEAVELCKKYASEDEYQFVNGVLGAYAREEA